MTCKNQPFPSHFLAMRWSHQQMNPFPVEWKLHSGQPCTQDFLHLAPRVFALRSLMSTAFACSQPVEPCPIPLIFCHPDKKLLFLSLRVARWQSGQHLACKAGSCFHCCRSCASEPVHPRWPWCCLPNPNKSQAQTAPANTPWWAPKARRKQSTDIFFFIFVIPAVVPAEYCLIIFTPANALPRGTCGREDQAVLSAEHKSHAGWPDLDCHTTFLSAMFFFPGKA